MIAGIFLLHLVLVPVVSYGVNKCHYCYKAATLAECKWVMNCGKPSQMCFMEEYKSETGGIFYHGGCASIDACETPGQVGLVNLTGDRTCATCCKSDFCNTNLCGYTVHGNPYYQPTLSPIHILLPGYENRCFSCDGVYNIQECSQTQTCRLGQYCYLEAYMSDNGRMAYYGGCASNRACASSALPVQKGFKVCATCCSHSFCNYDVCGTRIQAYNAASHTGPPKRQCYQCYDQHLDDMHRCFHKVECSSSTSQCSHVMRNENGIITVDLDCEENLLCTSGNGTNHQTCGMCCNWDGCNRDVDCRYPVKMTTPVPAQTSTIASASNLSTDFPHRQCYQCFDLTLDSRGKPEPCYHVITCPTSTSRCSSVFRQDHDILTVDMDCEDNMACDANQNQIQLCGRCCDTDKCNHDNDCRQQAPLTPTAKETTTKSYTGVDCEVCNGTRCGLGSGRVFQLRCPDSSPFCLNTVINDANGDKHVTKRCGSFSECERSWLQKSSQKTDCITFDPSSIYKRSFECSYCCVTQNCNRNIRPDNGTIFTGTV